MRRIKLGEIKENDIRLPFGLRIVARKLGVDYSTIRKRIQRGQWDALPELFRTAPRGDWKCTWESLEKFLRNMRGGAE
jgi:uncharacterized protein YjcR